MKYFFILLLTIISFSCTEDLYHNIPSIAPNLAYSAPSDSQANISPNSSLLIFFTQDMNVNTINTNTVTLFNKNNNVLKGTISHYGTRVAIYNPENNLEYNHIYTISLSKDISNINNTKLNKNINIFFKTSNQIISNNINIIDIQVSYNNNTINIYFDKDINPFTINDNINVYNNNDKNISLLYNYKYDCKNKVITLNVKDININNIYTLEINTFLTDLAGNTLSHDYIYTIDNSFVNITDNIPPSILEIIKENESFIIYFSEQINEINLNNIIIKNQLNNILSFSDFNYDKNNNSVTIYPTSTLSNSDTYTITLPGGHNGISDLAGNYLLNDLQFIIEPTITDLLPPNIINVYRDVNSTFHILFNENIDTTNIQSITIKNQFNEVINGSISYDINTHIVSIATTLPIIDRNSYTITIPGGQNGISDHAGNYLLNDLIFTLEPNISKLNNIEHIDNDIYINNYNNGEIILHNNTLSTTKLLNGNVFVAWIAKDGVTLRGAVVNPEKNLIVKSPWIIYNLFRNNPSNENNGNSNDKLEINNLSLFTIENNIVCVYNSIFTDFTFLKNTNNTFTYSEKINQSLEYFLISSNNYNTTKYKPIFSNIRIDGQPQGIYSIRISGISLFNNKLVYTVFGNGSQLHFFDPINNILSKSPVINTTNPINSAILLNQYTQILPLDNDKLILCNSYNDTLNYTTYNISLSKLENSISTIQHDILDFKTWNSTNMIYLADNNILLSGHDNDYYYSNKPSQITYPDSINSKAFRYVIIDLHGNIISNEKSLDNYIFGKTVSNMDGSFLFIGINKTTFNLEMFSVI